MVFEANEYDGHPFKEYNSLKRLIRDQDKTIRELRRCLTLAILELERMGGTDNWQEAVNAEMKQRVPFE